MKLRSKNTGGQKRARSPSRSPSTDPEMDVISILSESSACSTISRGSSFSSTPDALSPSDVNQVIIEAQLISDQMMDQFDVKNRNMTNQGQKESSNLKIEQCRVVLDPTYDEITTVFHLAPKRWEFLNSKRCWFCCKVYDEEPQVCDPVPCAISMQWLSDKQVRFVVDGSFCNFSCSKAWCNEFFTNRKGAYGDPDRNLWGKTEKNANAFLYRAWTQNPLKKYNELSEALPRRLLAAFGGPMSYADYIKHNTQTDPRTSYVTRKPLPFPMISSRQLLLEEVSVQDMAHNLTSELHLQTARIALPPTDLLLKKRIQHLQARGSHLNQNEGFS